MVFRLVPSVYVLATPFFVRSRPSILLTMLQANSPQIYGFAFLFVGLAGPIHNSSRTWLQNVGTGLYSFASSSGSIFFALNFGDEGMQQSIS
jgi:alpha-1,3-glucan synthase